MQESVKNCRKEGTMAEIIDLVMRLQDQVTGTLGHIRNEMEQHNRTYQQMGRNLSNAGRHVSALAGAMMPLSAGIAAAGAVGVKTFMDFDQTITAAGVKAGATSEEMNQMRDAAAQMGAKFPTTARDVAAGMDRLAAGGFNASQAIGAMPGIIETSIASGEDLAQTSDVITSALSTWNLTTGDVAANTTHVADVIQTAANSSKLGMQDFGTAMQYVGGTAASMGVSLEDVSSAMAILANNGIEASTIGTSLRTTMLNLINPTGQAQDAFTALGLSVADFTDGNGNFIGIQKSVDRLRTSMEGLTPVEKSAFAQMIAGKEAAAGLSDLLKTSPEAYQQMSDAITNSAGSSHAAYIQMQKTLKGSIDALMSSVEALGISFGSALAPTIQSVAGALKGIADTFTNLSPETKTMIIHVGEAVLAFTALTYATGKALTIAGSISRTYGLIGKVLHGETISNKALQFAVQQTSGAFSALGRALPALMGPMGLVVAGVALAAYVIYKNWDTIGPFFTTLWNNVKGAFSAAWDSISPLLDALRGAWDTLMDSFSEGEGVFGVLNALSDVLAAALSGPLYAGVVIVAGVVSGVLSTAFNLVVNSIRMAIGVFTGLIKFITGVFTGDWETAWEGVVQVFDSVFGGLRGIVEGVMAGIKSAINAVIAGINNISVDVPDWVPDYGGQHIGFNIPYLARGTRDWPGGPAVINDRGGEIAYMPSGSVVLPHDNSIRAAYNMGSQNGNQISVNVNFYGTSVNNMGDIKEIARQIAAEIQRETEKIAINNTVGAI